MDKLISDRARNEISNKTLDILRNLFIDSWQSEPYHEHQNAAKGRIQEIKKAANTVMVVLVHQLVLGSWQFFMSVSSLTGRHQMH